MRQHLLTLQEAINQLDMIELGNKFNELSDKLPIHGEIDDAETYQDLLDKTAEKAAEHYFNELLACNKIDVDTYNKVVELIKQINN